MTAAFTLLVLRAQTGDRAALNELLTQLQAPLYRHVCGVMNTSDGAEDVLQEVLLKIARKLGSVREPDWARAWAYRIANREAVRASQRARTHAQREVDVEDAAALETADEPHSDAELLRQLPQLVDSLPPAARIVIRMHYLEQLTMPEVAAALELPIGTAKSRLARGLNALRKTVARDNEPQSTGRTA